MARRRTARLPGAKFLALAALFSGFSGALGSGCNPYRNFDGEYFAGAIDATNFAEAYLGELPGPAEQGGGVIAGQLMWINGAQSVHYIFPFTDGQLAQVDPLGLDPGLAPAPNAYVFDPEAGNAFATPKCKGPEGYVHDQRTEAWRADEQGVIFSTVPSAAGYIPVVAQVPVSSNGTGCQSIKSKQHLLEREDVTMPADSDGQFLAFAIVDPGADVTPNLSNGLGPVHIGWFNHYLVTFLDGGYVPTETVPGTSMTDPYTRMTPQSIYTPTAIPGMDDMMNPVPVRGGLGTGWDIVTAARGETDYSPVCHVFSYVPDDPMSPKTSVADLSPTEVASTGAADADLGYVFCLQPF
jgi:hypothetical protein